MRKKPLFSRFCVCFLFILVLVISETAYAANTNTLKYVSLGDSIPGGIGLPDNPFRGKDQPDKKKVFCYKTKGAYPALIAEGLGIRDENFSQLACAGMRTVELRACLDDNYRVPDRFANNFTSDELETWVKSRYDYPSIIADADIITFGMCANDIVTYAYYCVLDVLNQAGVKDSDIPSSVTGLERSGNYTGALAKLLAFAADTNKYVSAAKAAVKGLSTGYSRWTENWDAIVKRIYKLNPDVTLVCIGMYNPFRSMKLSASSDLEPGILLDGIVTAANSWVSCGSAYAGRYIYVEVMDVETLLDSTWDSVLSADFFSDFALKIHPSAKGHRQIADKVLAALNSADLPSPIEAILKKKVGSIVRKAAKEIKRFAKHFN